MNKAIIGVSIIFPFIMGSCGISTGVNSIPYNPMGRDGSYIVRLGKKYEEMGLNELQRLDPKMASKDLIAIVDYNYQNYEGNLLSGKGKRGFAFDSAGFLLSTGSSILSAASTKTVLSAISAGVQSTQSGIDKHLFSEQSIDVLITRMRALRKRALVKIKEGVKRGEFQYDTRDLIIDIQKYYRAGTVASAIQDILQESSEKTKEIDKEATKKLNSLQ